MTQSNGAVLVTGSSAGIGEAIVRTLDKAGYRVFAGVRKLEDGARLKAESSDRLTPIILDVTKPEQIAEAIQTVKTALGPDSSLLALVNNAGIAVAGPLEFLPTSEIRRVLEVNVIGQIAMIQACLPLLRGSGGRIIQISSGVRNFALPFLGSYVISKTGMCAALDVFRRELWSWKIPVSEVLPGLVKTPMWDKYKAPANALQSSMPEFARSQAASMEKGRDLFEMLAKKGHPPEKVAGTVLRALRASRPRRRYIVSGDARMALLIPRLIPGGLLDRFIPLFIR